MIQASMEPLVSAASMSDRGDAIVMTAGDGTAGAARFVQAFAKVWARPTVEGFAALLSQS